MPGGAPKKPDEEKRIPCSFKLPVWILDWLREQPKSQSVAIEEALVAQYGIKQPKRKKR